jgi:hypothetical protein
MELLWWDVFLLSGERLSPLGTATTTGLLYPHHMINDGDCGSVGRMKIGSVKQVLGENRPQRRFVHHKSHITRPGLEPEQPMWEDSN